MAPPSAAASPFLLVPGARLGKAPARGSRGTGPKGGGQGENVPCGLEDRHWGWGVAVRASLCVQWLGEGGPACWEVVRPGPIEA